MLRVFTIVLLAAVVAGLAAITARRARRRATANPELQKHPERLDQMLDPTDDA
jgi:hypothetical protein